MNCSDVQSRLSAYHDNELSSEASAHVGAHLADCPICSAELASFEQLSAMSRRLTDPPVPAELWSELQTKLEVPKEQAPPRLISFQKRFFSSGLLRAASVLVALGIGLVTYKLVNSPEQDHLAVNFSHYLDQFVHQPEEAQNILLTSYHGRSATMQEATNKLGYEPLASQGLPPGYSVDKVYVLEMPCCTCAQIICKNSKGHSIAIFEHAVDQPVWFGKRPAIECLCQDTPTQVVQFQDRLAATWKAGKRYFTVVGAKDLDEITDFVAHYNDTEAG